MRVGVTDGVVSVAQDPGGGGLPRDTGLERVIALRSDVSEFRQIGETISPSSITSLDPCLFIQNAYTTVIRQVEWVDMHERGQFSTFAAHVGHIDGGVLGKFVFQAEVVLHNIRRPEMRIDEVDRSTAVEGQEASGAEIDIMVD